MDTQAANPPPSPPKKVLVLDPIGHLLAPLDHAACAALAARGFDVTLGANEHYDLVEGAPPYHREKPFGGVVGDHRGKIQKVLNYWKGLQRVKALVRRLRPDTVILYYTLQPHFDLLLFRWLKRRKVRILLFIHDVLPLRTDRDSLGGYRRLYLAADQVCVFSHYAKRVLEERLRFPMERVLHTHLGVDHLTIPEASERNLARRRLGIPDSERMVLCFGQIRASKTTGPLLEAMRTVLSSHPDARLYMVGQPSRMDFAPFLALAEDLGIADRVVFRLEHVPQEAVADWHDAADVMVLPYTRLYQSGVMLQAIAHGKAVVATDVGNFRELITPGEDGWIVPPLDVPALAEALSEALSDLPKTAERGHALRQKIYSEQTWTRFATALEPVV